MKFLRNQIDSLPDPARRVVSYMFKAYIAWSICADIIIVAGIVYLIIH